MASDLNGASAHSRGRRSVSARLGASRLAATACLAAATSFAFPPVVAHAAPSPKPKAADVQKKINKLNEQVDQLVEKYNQVNEQLKIAKKKLDAANKGSKSEQSSFEEQRSKIAEMAATAYKNGDATEVTGFVSSNDPQAVLDQAAVFSHLSRERSSQLSQFLETTQRLRREQAQAQAAFNEVAGKAKELKAQKAKVDKSIKEQKRLLASIGETPDRPGTSSGGSGGGSSTGGTYTGPASGSARKALEFAYQQLGKAYEYGATGPKTYDCSGLTMRAWGAAGVNITRTTNSQYAATKRIARSAAQPGDLLFFNGLGHVGLYIGGGKMIHAPRTGKNVEIVDITSGYYQANYYGAGRP